MKKIINRKALNVIVSSLLVCGFANSAFALDKASPVVTSENSVIATTATANNAEKGNDAADAKKTSDIKKPVILNQQLRSLLSSQEDAQKLLNDPNISIDATLGDIAKYNALTAVQDAKNKLEESGNPKGNSSGNGTSSASQSYSDDNSGVTASQQSTSDSSKKENSAPTAPKIVVTAVYTLGKVGYAEVDYNGGKTVVREGDKLPGGEVIESLTPLSVVIKVDNKDKTFPIVSDQSSTDKNGQQSGQNGSSDYTLSAPHVN